MINSINLPDEELLDVVKAQFFHDCISASLKKDASNTLAYEVDWDAFEKHFNSAEVLLPVAGKALLNNCQTNLVTAIDAIKQMGKKLKAKKAVARLLSSI
jgi:hypothetical protein